MDGFEKQHSQTEEFAAQTTRTVRTVSQEAPDFQAQARVRKGQWRATIMAPQDAPVPLYIGGKKAMRLRVSYECTVSTRHDFMLIERSQFALLPVQGNEPLMRLEYNRHPRSDTPSAHLHIHAHRDAWTYAMTRDGADSPRQKVVHREEGRIPQLSDLHIPAGGPRLRPTLEDFLQMLICDLGITHSEDALDILQDQRAQWREGQVRSMVSSMEGIAADTLRASGWAVTPPTGHEVRDGFPYWLSRY